MCSHVCHMENTGSGWRLRMAAIASKLPKRYFLGNFVMRLWFPFIKQKHTVRGMVKWPICGFWQPFYLLLQCCKLNYYSDFRCRFRVVKLIIVWVPQVTTTIYISITVNGAGLHLAFTIRASNWRPTLIKGGQNMSQNGTISRTYAHHFHALSPSAGAHGMGIGDTC